MFPDQHKPTKTMNIQYIKTRIDGTAAFVKADFDEIKEDTFFLDFLIGRGIRTMTYDAKEALKELELEEEENIDLETLRSLCATKGGTSIETAFIDEAASKLRKLGAKIGKRPAARVKGDPGAGVNPSTWASNIDLGEELAEKLGTLFEAKGFDGDATTLLGYAGYLSWKHYEAQREADKELLGLE